MERMAGAADRKGVQRGGIVCREVGCGQAYRWLIERIVELRVMLLALAGTQAKRVALYGGAICDRVGA